MRVTEATPGDCRQRSAPPVVSLSDRCATDGALVGAKAASLARAASAGLPALPGFVVTTAVSDRRWEADDVPAEIRSAWAELSDWGRLALVVRSSSTVEDGGSTSMAGVFTSVLDVVGWDAFVDALATVTGSAKSVPGIEMAPMGVLVQPMLRPRFGGVLFGADPVTGQLDQLVVAAVEGGPDQLVSGQVDGAHYTLARNGRLRSSEAPLEGLDRRELGALAALARRVAGVFGGPQDIEWAIDHDGRLYLLQARPITAVGHAQNATGPVLGPGPVAETFPDPLTPLEQELWLAPLRQALTEALDLTGTASARRLRTSPVLVSVGGRLAVDLDLLGARPQRKSFLARFDPRPPARRLRASWRVGRLRAAMAGLAEDVVGDTDRHLLDVPPLHDLRDAQLLELLRRASGMLVALHGHEVLAGLLSGDASPATGHAASGASVALRALAQGRSAGHSDADIIAESPAVLALVPPRIGPAPVLPVVPSPAPTVSPTNRSVASATTADATAGSDDVPLEVLREALRMRVRWVHELQARVSWELGLRLHEADVLTASEHVRLLTFGELEGAIEYGLAPSEIELTERASATPVAPLPAAFRLTPEGHVVPMASQSAGAARGAGGGRNTGRVHQGPGTPEAGAVLVVRTLDPALAPVLPSLGGLVAETGSVLSHLAILAREFSVPTVVGLADAMRRFPAGSLVIVDGSTGEVTLVDQPTRNGSTATVDLTASLDTNPTHDITTTLGYRGAA